MGEQTHRLDASVYRRRRLLVAGAAAAAIPAMLFLTKEVVGAFEHANDPIPAACTTYLAPGENRWDIAIRIGEHVVGQDTGEIDFKLGRANPDVHAADMQPGPIGVPQEFCPIVQDPNFNE